MSIYKNGEGYPDPTAGAAIARVLREQKNKKRLQKKESGKKRMRPEAK